MADPIMWRALAVHPSHIAVEDLIRDLAGSSDGPGYLGRRDAVLSALDACERVGLLELDEADVSVVATEEAFSVRRCFID
jgi:hypothetical protein